MSTLVQRVGASHCCGWVVSCGGSPAVCAAARTPPPRRRHTCAAAAAPAAAENDLQGCSVPAFCPLPQPPTPCPSRSCTVSAGACRWCRCRRCRRQSSQCSIIIVRRRRRAQSFIHRLHAPRLPLYSSTDETAHHRSALPPPQPPPPRPSRSCAISMRRVCRLYRSSMTSGPVASSTLCTRHSPLRNRLGSWAALKYHQWVFCDVRPHCLLRAPHQTSSACKGRWL